MFYYSIFDSLKVPLKYIDYHHKQMQNDESYILENSVPLLGSMKIKVLLNLTNRMCLILLKSIGNLHKHIFFSDVINNILNLS
jgi:hypothetical protein